LPFCRAAHAQAKLEARYNVTLAGIPLGTGTWVIDIAATSTPRSPAAAPPAS